MSRREKYKSNTKNINKAKRSSNVNNAKQKNISEVKENMMAGKFKEISKDETSLNLFSDKTKNFFEFASSFTAILIGLYKISIDLCNLFIKKYWNISCNNVSLIDNAIFFLCFLSILIVSMVEFNITVKDNKPNKSNKIIVFFNFLTNNIIEFMFVKHIRICSFIVLLSIAFLFLLQTIINETIFIFLFFSFLFLELIFIIIYIIESLNKIFGKKHKNITLIIVIVVFMTSFSICWTSRAYSIDKRSFYTYTDIDKIDYIAIANNSENYILKEVYYDNLSEIKVNIDKQKLISINNITLEEKRFDKVVFVNNRKEPLTITENINRIIDFT